MECVEVDSLVHKEERHSVEHILHMVHMGRLVHNQWVVFVEEVFFSCAHVRWALLL